MEKMGKAALCVGYPHASMRIFDSQHEYRELIAQAGFGYTFGVLEGFDNDYSSAAKRLM